MDKHGLLVKGWVFEFDNAKRRFGVCNYTDRVIGLSKALTELNDEEKVIDTILHEIAHALTPGQHHNHVWRAKAIEIGCNGNRCYNSKDVETPDSKYKAICSGCNKTHKKHKKPTRTSSCGVCSGGRYTEKYKLVWVQNY